METLCRKVRPNMAEALRASVDELAVGREPADPVPGVPIRNKLFFERFRNLETLPNDDRSVVLKLLDALIAARGVELAVARARRTA